MNIVKENIDDLNAIVKVTIEESDYLPKVNEVLVDFRKKARFDGFRPGKAPMGIVKKLYGKSALLEEVNKLLSEKLSNFLFESDFRILGEPLPNDASPKIDWDKQKDFEFAFDIALAPVIEVKLSKRDKIKWYHIEPEESMVNDQVENYTKRYGGFEPVDTAASDDMVKGDFIELDEQDQPKKEGLEALDAMVAVNTIPSDAKDQFIGLKIGDELVVDMALTFPNEADRAALLNVKKDELADLAPKFKLTGGEVTRFTPGPVDQDLFDKVYGPDVVSSEEEFRLKLKEELQAHLDRESFYKFHLDVREKLTQKFDISLPDAFLKRWMLSTSKEDSITEESINEEYPRFSEDLKWQLIKDQIIKENEIKVSEDEIRSEAVNVARAQFQQYGYYDVPEENLVQFAGSILRNEDEQRKISERIFEDKVIAFVKEAVKLEDQNVSLDEFKKLFE